MVTVPTQPVVQEDWVNDVKMVLAEKRGRIEGVTAKYPSSSDGKHKYFSMNALDRIRVGATLFRRELRVLLGSGILKLAFWKHMTQMHVCILIYIYTYRYMFFLFNYIHISVCVCK